jgi:WD40 repeat protein
VPDTLDPTKTRQVLELKHASPLLACRFDPTGQTLVTSAQDNGLQRWQLADGKKTDLPGHKSWVRALAFHPRTGTLFSGSYAGQVLAWTADAATPALSIDAHDGWVRAAAVSPDGTLLATCGNDLLVKLWSTADGKLVRELAGHQSHVYNVAFRPSGQALASADLHGVVREWDVAQGTLIRELDAGLLHKYDEVFRADIGGARAMAYSRDGGLLACAGITDVSNAFAGIGKPVVVLFDWRTGKRVQLLRPKEEFQGTAWGVAFHPAGFVVGVGAGNGGALWFWRPEEAKSFFTLPLPNNARDVDLHPDGKRLAVAFFDGVARVYDVTPPG